MIGHESEYLMETTQAPKNVWVIGGGVGGMEAAQVLQARGHKVTLWLNRQKGELLYIRIPK